MTINYTTLLGLAQPVTGTEQGTWGDTVNTEITALLEDAIADAATFSVTAGDVTLTSTAGQANQARMAILLVTGTPGVSRNIIAPSQSKWYIVKNSSDASVVLKGSATTGVTILAGTEALCFWNGSDFEIVGVNGPSSSTDNAVVRFDGTTGKVIQNSGVIIDDSNNVSGMGTLGVGAITTTGVFTATAGTVSAPAITTTGDTNTGIFFPAADTIGFAEGGVEAMRIDSSGNVGIGVTPSAWSTAFGQKAFQFGPVGSLMSLQAATNNNQTFVSSNAVNLSGGWTYMYSDLATQYRQYAGTHVWFTAPSGTAGNAITFTQAMTLDASGNLGIGTSSPLMPLQISNYGGLDGNSNQLIIRNNVYYDSVDGRAESIKAGFSTEIYMNNYDGSILFYTTASSAAGANTAITLSERMRIDSSGNVGIGITTPTQRLSVGGSANTEVYESIGDNLERVKIGHSVTTGISTGIIPIQLLTDNTGNVLLSSRGNNASNIILYTSAGSTATERMRIDSSGNVGIGTSSPSSANYFSARAVVNRNEDTTNDTVVFSIANTESTNTLTTAALQFVPVGTSSLAQPRIVAKKEDFYGNAGQATASLQFKVANSNTYNTALDLRPGGQVKALNTISVGNATPSTSGAGITFPATQSASSDANTLDDYEEGAWTPVAADATSGGNTTTAGTGYYRKIGSVVIAWFRLTDINTTGLTAGNAFNVQGLPFSSGIIADNAYGNIATDSVTFGGYCVPSVNGGLTSFKVADCQTGAAYTQLLVSAFTDDQADLNGFVIYIS